ncbi:hypothetical protein B0T18DRAFT_436685 [Schizothecium vesticola]|uniref:HD domain-containing protein n=1 Tax=Schizothecium vesticola TaxID=314040 RepID=A0AA40F0H9_9PEZI|nr:hypothetical protein B0T18DRAFT_436685 [Schizothecium vesticola]
MPPSTSPFTPLPISLLSLPSTPLLQAAHAFLLRHTSPSTTNHCLRSAFFALLLLRRLPAPPTTPQNEIDTEALLLAIILHDLGWSTTPSLLSTTKRFEVDGANAARDFFLSHAGGEKDARRVQLVWDAIALHTTPSIALHKEREVAVAAMGIAADFQGAYFSLSGGAGELGGLITVEEHQEIVRGFPREGFRGELVGIMCGLCRDKPETVVDNFVGDFGVVYGLDGEGGGREEVWVGWKGVTIR